MNEIEAGVHSCTAAECGLFDTYLVAAAGAPVPQNCLSAGMPVTLRACRCTGRLTRFDVWTGNGLLLGKLPPAEAQTLNAVCNDNTLSAEIAALIPTAYGQRVHLRVAVPR